MSNDIENEYHRNPPIGTKRRLNTAPLHYAFITVIVAVATVLAAAAVGKAVREKKRDVIEAVHTVNTPENGDAASSRSTPAPKFNHVIFRLGGEEIFRFTYEDAGEDARYSFEVREGGS